MCRIAKIKSLNIDGYVKTKSVHIGSAGILDHAWNAVIIDGQTYYLDLTWASGYCEKNKKGKLEKFIKQRNDFYWFTPTDKFSVDHFPKTPSNIQNFDLSKDDYKNQPYIEKSIIPFIEIIQPKEGILKPNVGDSIIFKFNYSKNINKIQINTNLKRNSKIYYTNKKGDKIFNQKNYEKQEYVPFQKNNNTYQFSYSVKTNELKYIEILFDYNIKLKYLIKIN